MSDRTGAGGGWASETGVPGPEAGPPAGTSPTRLPVTPAPLNTAFLSRQRLGWAFPSTVENKLREGFWVRGQGVPALSQRAQKWPLSPVTDSLGLTKCLSTVYLVYSQKHRQTSPETRPSVSSAQNVSLEHFRGPATPAPPASTQIPGPVRHGDTAKGQEQCPA